MKILLSLNYKFFNVEAEKLMQLIKKYDTNNLIYGFEVSIASEKDKKYLLELVHVAAKEGYIVNLHSPVFENLEKGKAYLDFAVNISKIMNRKINVVYHPINAESIKESKKITKESVNKLFEIIEQNNYLENIDLSIENLNNINGVKRLKKEDLIEILEEQPKLKFTYDIGHEIIDGLLSEELCPILNERLNNIHIHTCKNNIDHYPINDYEEQSTKNVKQLLNKMEENGYNENIVMEYAIDYIEGNSFEEKLRNYIKCAKIL